MEKDALLKDIDDVHAEFRLLIRGHVPAGCANGWFLQPFPVFVLNLRGYGETVYRNEILGTVPRPEKSVAYVIPNEARRSVTKSPEGLDFIVTGFSFEYHSGANFLNLFRIGNILPEKTQRQMRSLILELAESEDREVPFCRKLIVRKKTGYGLLNSLMSCAELRPAPDKDWQRLHPVLEYLNKNYKSRFDIGELLRMTPFSRVHFYRIFHRRFHMAPQEYITRLRIREAAKLLLDSDRSVAEIGAEVGWEDPFYFSKIFKSVIGASPLNYRKNPGGIS